MTFYVVYKTTNNLNGHYYIGKHITENLEDGYLGSGILIRQAIKKYGKENFTKEILFFLSSKEEMELKEKELVIPNYLDSTSYNIVTGGGGSPIYGRPLPEETIRKIVEKRRSKNNYAHTEETKLKLSRSHLGQKAWNKGTPNEKAKGAKFYNNGKIQKMFKPGTAPQGWSLGRINKSPNLGKARSEATKEKLRRMNLGKKQSSELIHKRVEARKGYKHSLETINKIQASRKKTYEARKMLKAAKENSTE